MSYTFVGGQANRGGVTITVNIDDAGVRKMMDGFLSRMRDLSPAMNAIPEKVIFPSVMQSFGAGGRPGWLGIHGNKLSMVKSGLMKRGLTSRDAVLNQITVTPDSMTSRLNPAPYIQASMTGDWGKRKGAGVFYPGIHQFGGKRHNQNIVLNLQDPQDIENIKALVADYIVTGQVK